jgi:hypothetical protein
MKPAPRVSSSAVVNGRGGEAVYRTQAAERASYGTRKDLREPGITLA